MIMPNMLGTKILITSLAYLGPFFSTKTKLTKGRHSYRHQDYFNVSPVLLLINMHNFVRIAGIDIGKRAFAIYNEAVSINYLDLLAKEYHELPKKKQRRVKGQMNDEIEGILEGVYLSGMRIGMDVTDIADEEDTKSCHTLSIQTRRNLYDHLQSLMWLWDDTDIILIEQQYFNTFSFGRKSKKVKGGEANIFAIKLAECTASWFMINYPDKEVEFFTAQFKTQMLGAPDGLTKPQRKKWAIQKTISLLELRGDEEGLNYIKSIRKKDDVSDACLIVQAYKFRTFVGQF
jgi:hypothetical protein